MVSGFGFEEIAAFSIMLSLKLVESFKKGFSSQEKIARVVDKFELNEADLMQNLYVIHNFTVEFEQRYPYIKNLKRFYRFSAA